MKWGMRAGRWVVGGGGFVQKNRAKPNNNIKLSQQRTLIASVTQSQSISKAYCTYRTAPCHTVAYRDVPYRAVPQRTIPYRTIPYRTLRTVPS